MNPRKPELAKSFLLWLTDQTISFPCFCKKSTAPPHLVEKGCGFFVQYCAASALFSCNCSLSAINAINSLFVGLPLVLLTV